MRYSKLILAASVAAVFVACDFFKEDNEWECKRYDNALYVSYETLSEVDSVQFFLNGARVCDGTTGRLIVTSAACDGRTDTHEVLGDCTWGNVSSEGFPQINLFECGLAQECDGLDVDSARMTLHVFMTDSTGADNFTIDSLPKFMENNRYAVMPESDTSFIKKYYPGRSRFYALPIYDVGCFNGFCVVQQPDDSIICVKEECTLGNPRRCWDNLK
ncbi:MAG: hypothetical protein WCR04_11545 [Fibrobacteraceae bacterium]